MQEKSDTPVSALWVAAHNGDRSAISLLVSEAVDVNVWDKWGRTALFFAVSTGRLEVARDLVRAGAWVDPHEDYDVYDSPLMHAAIRGDRPMVLFLLEEGADPTRHVGISQQTAANYARREYPDIAILLNEAEDKKRAIHSPDPMGASVTPVAEQPARQP